MATRRTIPSKNNLIYEIVSAVAEETGDDPLAMTPPLYDAIDLDTLHKLLQNSPEGLPVSFEYQGQHIDVTPGGLVDVRDAPRE